MVDVAAHGEEEQEMPMEPPLSPRTKQKEFEMFEKIIYSNLEDILEERPNFPVSRFAKKILQDVNLDENGEPLEIKKKKKDKKDKKNKKEKAHCAKELRSCCRILCRLVSATREGVPVESQHSSATREGEHDVLQHPAFCLVHKRVQFDASINLSKRRSREKAKESQTACSSSDRGGRRHKGGVHCHVGVCCQGRCLGAS